MVLGFPLSEVIFLMVTTVVMLGPKDLPIIARTVGRLTGRAVGYMQTIRGQMDTFMDKSQANQMQKELRETMAQLDAIRYEIRTGMSITHPRPFVRESIGDSFSHLQQGLPLKGNLQSGLQQAASVMKKIETVVDSFEDTTMKENDCQAEAHHKSLVDLQYRATSYARFAGHLSTVEKSHEATVNNSMSTPQAGPSSENDTKISVLPISAISMGLFSHAGPIRGGSDLVLESLAERKVAQQAMEFLQQPESEQDAAAATLSQESVQNKT